jgi:hypothetical protein
MTQPEGSPKNPSEAPDWLVAKMDEEFERMQDPEVRVAVDKAFHMSPAQIAELLRNPENPDKPNGDVS